MRLLDAQTFEFKDSYDFPKPPKYAILSHTWAEKEVTFSDLVSSLSSRQLALQRPEFTKIKFTAEQALKDGLKYIWVDTCNIDKSSSAELSETINSMFRLYREAEVCYIYLSDVIEPPPEGWIDGDEHTRKSAWTKAFTSARWFTRGWTLQELIAPRKAIFYTKEWKTIGTKRELSHTIERATGIPERILDGVDFKRNLVAERMYWASRRKTARAEDQAYCLLGLFDIHMPLLYGEGGYRAFLRLQYEIIKTTNDRSIFLWTARKGSHTSMRSFFARAPAEFASFNRPNLDAKYGRFEVTQRGLEIEVPLIEEGTSDSCEFLGAVVQSDSKYWSVRLRKLGADEYARVDSERIFCPKDAELSPNHSPQSKLIIIPNMFDHFSFPVDMDHRLGGFHIEHYPIELQIHSVTPSSAWDKETNIIGLDYSKNPELFSKDIETSLKIVFSLVSNQDQRHEFYLKSMLPRHAIDRSVGYPRPQGDRFTINMTKRVVHDKMMNVVRIDHYTRGREQEGSKDVLSW